MGRCWSRLRRVSRGTRPLRGGARRMVSCLESTPSSILRGGAMIGSGNTFADYGARGFLTELLPLIPPGATLSPSSDLSADKLGKVPGKRRPDGWVGFAKWAQH